MKTNKTPNEAALGHILGKTQFVDDEASFKEELCVGLILSTITNGKIISIDTTALSEIEGSDVHVFTAKDLHHNRYGTIKADQPLLAETQVSYFGEPIAIVAAADKTTLALAKTKIKVTYSEEAATLSLHEALKKGDFLYKGRHFSRGDIEKSLAESAQRICGEISIGGQEHFYLENQSCLAIPRGESFVEVVSSTQAPSETQHVVAEALGLGLHQVNCRAPKLGGGFGGKETQASQFAALTALPAFILQKPCRLILSKDEDMISTGKRHPFWASYEVGTDTEGRILAAKIFLVADGGAYTDLSPSILDRALYHADSAYYLPVVDIQGVVVKTNHHSNTAMRGFGAPQAHLVMENIIESISLQLGKDSAHVRQVNLYQKAHNNITPYGQVVEANVLPEIVEKILHTSQYNDRLNEIKKHNQNSRSLLRGIALTPCKFGISFTTRFLNQGSALVHLQMDGSAQVATGAIEMGQGVFTKIQYIVAQELSLPMEKVHVLQTSTEKNANTSPTAASTGSDINGSAALMATQKIKRRLQYLAHILFTEGGVREFTNEEFSAFNDFSSVTLKDQIFYSKNSSSSVALKDLLALARRCRVSLSELAHYATPISGNNPFYYYTQGAAVTEVSIDTYSGRVQVEQVDILMDIGQPLHAQVDLGQITGSYVQSMGWMTLESLHYNDKGHLLTHSPSTYKIPTITDMPKKWNIEFFDNQEHQINVLRSKAVGEPPYLFGIGTWLAVKNALSAKVSSDQLTKMKVPASPEEILSMLHGW